MKRKHLLGMLLIAISLLFSMSVYAEEYTQGWHLIDDEWYYADENGTFLKEWQFIEGKWYYFSTGDGSMFQNCIASIRNTETNEMECFAFDKSGAMYSNGWCNVRGIWYYAEGNGLLRKGWVQDGDNWYYCNRSMCKNGRYTLPVSEGSDEVKRYYFKYNGQLVRGWYNAADAYSKYPEWVYCNADGSVYDGWLLYAGQWYYIDEGYAIQEDYVNEYIDANGNITTDRYDSETGKSNSLYRRYYMGIDGAMVTGWYQVKEYSKGMTLTTWIYAQPDGTIKEGWVYSGGKKYYVDSYGDMYSATINYIDIDDDETKHGYYVFGSDGALVSGWHEIKTSVASIWVYGEADGKAYDGWVLSGGKWYYIYNGRMLTNVFTPDGYYVGADGVMQ